MKFRLSLAALLGATVLAGGLPAVALAQAAPPPPAAHGGPADMDRDRVVTRAEALEKADRRFDAIDANHDGKVTREEMRAEHDRMRARREARAGEAAPPPLHDKEPRTGMGRHRDFDRDGVVSRDEWRRRAVERFDRMDTNHDGRVDAQERAAAHELRRMRRLDRRDGAPPPPPPAPMGDPK